MIRFIIVLSILMAFIIPSGYCQEDPEEEIKRLKKELNKLSKVKYRNLIEYKKEQQNMYRKLNSLEYALQYKVDTLFKRLDQVEGESYDGEQKHAITEFEQKLQENLKEDFELLREEIQNELESLENEKSTGDNFGLLVIVFGILIIIVPAMIFLLLNKKLVGIKTHLSEFEKHQTDEVHKFEEGLHNEIRKISKTISNNRLLAFRDSKDLSKQLRNDHDMLHDYIVHNNIDLMEMKSQLISLNMKSSDNNDHKMAVELGNDLFFTKSNIKEGDNQMKEIQRLEKEFNDWGYKIEINFKGDISKNKNIEIEWKEERSTKKGEFKLVNIKTPVIYYNDELIQKGSIVASKSLS